MKTTLKKEISITLFKLSKHKKIQKTTTTTPKPSGIKTHHSILHPK